MKKNPVFSFISILTLLTWSVFALHLFVLNFLEKPLFENQILLAYVVNYALAFLIGLAIYVLRNNFTSSLGFIFLGGSMVKFLLFYILFYAGYHADDSVSTLEFTTLFIPYAVCLVVETTFLIRVLNWMGKDKA